MKLNKGNKKGISLIVLVITIIVMIILAAAIILSLNSSGIIGKANQAKTDSNNANLLEAATIAAAEWNLEYKLGNTTDNAKTYITKKLQDQDFTDEQIAELKIKDNGEVSIVTYKMYKDANEDEAPIPDGFVASSATGENTIEYGLVIYEGDEAVTDDNVDAARETRNQYVWVPVSDISEFKLINWLNESNFETRYVEPLTASVSLVTDIALYSDEIARYNAMKASVETNGGFYIARYEAGFPEGKTNSSVKIDGTDKPVSKKGAMVWYDIAWDSTWQYDWNTNELKSSIAYGDDSNPGAALVANKSYESSESVVSTLCYGVQWDAALQFIAKSNPDYPTDETGKTGWNEETTNWECTLMPAGTDIDSQSSNRVNNIYDMAGNVKEWTYEVENINNNMVRIYRAGSAADTKSNSPAQRCGEVISSTFFFGFRVALYIK